MQSRSHVTAVGELAPPPVQEPEIVPPEGMRTGQVLAVVALVGLFAYGAWVVLRDDYAR